MSSVIVPRVPRIASSSGPKSSPTGPTGRTSSKNDAARLKWVAAPPSMRSRDPEGVLTASKARDPTTVRLMTAREATGIAWRAMRAIQQLRFGGPEVLELVELPEPVAGPGEVLVRVARAGMNFADTHQRHNVYLAAQELPLVPGSEVAGVRADTGERVVALCRTGGYAEYATAPEALTFPIPDGVDDGTALALLIQGLTAWHLYRTSGRVAEGESVLVISGAGGVGSLATQLGHGMGAGRVIATASSAEKRALALELGADAAISGDPEGLEERIVEANGGRQVDVVFEMAGGAVFDACLAATAPFGRLVTYGIAGGEGNRVHTRTLMARSISLVGFWLFDALERPGMVAPALDDLYARASRGDLRAVVGATYPLAEAARAQQDIADRRTTGKVLLDPTA